MQVTIYLYFPTQFILEEEWTWQFASSVTKYNNNVTNISQSQSWIDDECCNWMNKLHKQWEPLKCERKIRYFYPSQMHLRQRWKEGLIWLTDWPKESLGLIRKDRGCNLTGVIRFAMTAFLANYVEVNFCSIVAIIAQNPNLLVAVVLGHSGGFNLLI